MWFYEYTAQIILTDVGPETVSGLVTGKSMSKAVKKLEKYYGAELEQIFSLKPIAEDAFEYALVMAENISDFSFYPKNYKRGK